MLSSLLSISAKYIQACPHPLYTFRALIYGDCFPDPGLALMVQDPVINITEPDEMNVTVSSCFRANTTRSRRKPAVFMLTFLNSSTAYQGLDFNVDHNPNVAIPAGFLGLFMECVNISIIGDNIIEGDEVIEYSVEPISEGDSVDPGPLRVNILDNDGNDTHVCT
jgi:hypothetical protein